MWIDIIIFAVVAVFLGLRLRSVLGQRTGEEAPPPRFEPPAMKAPPPMKAPGPVVDAPGESAEPRPLPPAGPAPDSLAGRLYRIGQADAHFDEKGFLSGARGAFEMIVAAFARGDTAALRPLLADDVYDNFAEAVRQRQAAKQTLETKIFRFKDVEIADADLELNTARVVVRFVTEQAQQTQNADGSVAEGDLTTPHEVTDVWTFVRNTRSLDPNWKLAETRSED